MKKTIAVVVCVVLLPFIWCEYFVLTWFWGGGDLFNFIATSIVFILYLIGLLLVKKTVKIKGFWNVFCTVLIVVIVPILTMATVWGIASLLGIPLEIA